MKYIILISALLLGCGGPECEDHDAECKKIDGVRTIENYPEGTTITIPPNELCNVYIANTQIGDSQKRSALFSRIAKIGCTIRGIFHAGFQISDKESWYKDSWVIFESHRASFWPTPMEITEANWLKGKFPYLEEVKACELYTIETSASWGTVVMDSRSSCDRKKQLDELRKVLDHGYGRVDIVMEEQMPEVQGILEEVVNPPKITVFTGNHPGYSRSTVGDVTYISSGMAGPTRSTCPSNADSCYPDTSFVVCTSNECQAISLYSEVDSF
jgi:hypothetical protein